MPAAKLLRVLLPGLLLLIAAPAALADLAAEHLLLITNRNVPESRQLAEYYRQARDVPDGRVIELDLPVEDKISREQYERLVVPAVRRFIQDNGLRQQVRCAVTFYGVPLIVGPRVLTEAERTERGQVVREASDVAQQLAPIVRDAEQVAARLGYAPPQVSPQDARRLEVLLGRLASAEAYIAGRGPALGGQQRQDLEREVATLRQRLERPFAPDGGTVDPAEIAKLLRAGDEASRRIVRDRLRARAGLRTYAQVLVQQQRLLSEEQSDAAFDSELATLWIQNAPAAGWLVNPLARDEAEAPPESVMMVSRLDGRSPQQVRDLIANSVRVERDGLQGKIVIDSRGIAPETDGNAGYGVFDEQLRRLADFLEQKATLAVVHDDAPEVIQPPGEAGVAVYVGWYSLMKYVRGMEFVPGAVGYHVASFEMRSLRDPALPGWVRGLLDDGVVATMGPVSEPYLVAFPPPEQFVPLLLTGELTLAETYWRTVPLMSWKLGLIGDPLYRPFGQRPALETSELPPPLRLRAGQ